MSDPIGKLKKKTRRKKKQDPPQKGNWQIAAHAITS